MAVELQNDTGPVETDTIEMPAPTAWPIALAFGMALLFAGMVTSVAVSVLGGIVAIAGAIGWFRNVLPYEAHEKVAVTTEVLSYTTARREVVRVAIAPELQRAFLPLEIYPISAGVKGGLAGSVAMAIVAMVYGLISSQHSIWYPINLLAAGFMPAAMTDSTATMAKFSLSIFLIAVAIHLLTSLLVGLLYGAMLPMLPRHPILLGGFIAPLFWTGLLHSILGIVNPVLNERIHWGWFVASQVAFGIVAGIIVTQQERIRTWQRLPLSVRSGMEASGMRDEKQ
jgi:membrane-associated protease RseP (regulator of RpoE activity)